MPERVAKKDPPKGHRKSGKPPRKKERELTPLELQQKQLKELREKLTDEAWRMCNLYCIENKWGDLVHFKPNRAQVQLFKTKHQGGNMILKARQLGISTGIAIWLLDKLWTKERQTAGIIDKTLTDAESKLRKIRIAYENMDNKKLVPAWRIGAYIKSQVKITSASSGRIEFSNGSSIVAGKSLRGGTVQYLHVSELGKIAQEEPKKAEEIVSGSLNTIAPGNIVFAESTHEGGRIGLHYKLLKASMENDPENLSPVDMKFFFFPWFWDPAYQVPATGRLRAETENYFAALERGHGITVTPEQKMWYDRKQAQQGDAMLKEYPSTPEEAFESSNRGAIYARQISAARAEGRILDFEPEAGLPVVCSWDLGVSDYTSIWALQFVGREIHWLDWYEASGETVAHFAAVMREWDRKYGNIAMHYLPHDAGYRDKNATTYVQHLAECGISNVTVVPRTPDIWMGINTLRDIMKRSLFHKTNCGTPRIDALGDEHLSGIDCLEAYRTKAVDAAGRISEQPIHDETSHSCDAARTIAEAYSRGMIGRDGSVAALRSKQFRPRVITGTGGDYQVRKLQAIR